MAEATPQQAHQPLKHTVTHYRQKEHTHEAFIKWMVEEHLQLAMPIFKRHGVLEYSLFVTAPHLNDALKENMSKVRPTWQVADFDCFIEYVIPDMGVIQKVLTDPDWPAAVKDEDKWVDTSKALVSLGHITPYLLKTGEVVNMPEA